MTGTLVTGSNGQLGNELRAIENKLPGIVYYTDIEELDICNKEAVIQFIKKNNIDLIVNCAAYTAVDKAEDEPAVAYKLNAEAPGFLAEAARENNTLLIHISTDYVFDGKGPKPYKESDITAPVSEYGKTKLAGEKAIENSGCRYLILRTSWLYSIYGNNFVKTIVRLAREKQELKVVFDQTGTPTFAADLALAIAEISAHKDDTFYIKNAENQIYNFSNEGVCSWYDFAVEIIKFTSNTLPIHPVRSEEFPSKVARPAFSVLDKTLIKKVYGINIPHWRDSLEKCMKVLLQTRL